MESNTVKFFLAISTMFALGLAEGVVLSLTAYHRVRNLDLTLLVQLLCKLLRSVKKRRPIRQKLSNS